MVLPQTGRAIPACAQVLLYNCGSGPLGYTNRCKVMIGFDNWANNARNVSAPVPYRQVPVAALQLPTSESARAASAAASHSPLLCRPRCLTCLALLFLLAPA